MKYSSLISINLSVNNPESSYRHHYQTRYAAQQDVLHYISMFYSSHRLHSYLGYKSPKQYEIEMEKLKKVA